MPMRSLAPWSGRLTPATSLFNQFEDIFNDFDRAFATPRRGVGAESGTEFAPALDFEERENEYVVCVDLPGMKKQDIRLDLAENTLTISGERLKEGKTEGAYSERPYGKFTRSLTLPAGVNADKVAAQFTDGVLYVTLPKSEEARSHSIKIM